MIRTSRRTRGYLVAGLIGVLMAALLATGCGGTSSADKTATAAAKNAAAATKPAGATSTKAASTAAAAATSTKAPATAATAGASTPSPGTPAVKIAQSASLGSILTDVNGMTLYTYADDVPNSGQSSVPASIAPNWPPLATTGGTPVAPSGLSGQLGTFTRTDGSIQVQYKGMPLYLFVGDKAPGDTNGQGLLN
ncbi:MAG: hypothetical protein ABR978_07415, partial [Dehalococcoidia bacterium]